jgi:RNA polymerase sigma factor for flagellar operon FliA
VNAIPRKRWQSLVNDPYFAYIEDPAQALFHQRILDNLPLVKHIINRMEIHLPGGMDREDLVSIGNGGLIEAAQKFDSTKNVKFQTYAYVRIRGAILDEIRKSSFGGQSIVRRQKQLGDAYLELQSRLNRQPTEEEVAVELGVTTEKLDQWLDETSGAHLISLDEQVQDDDTYRRIDQMSNSEDQLDQIIHSEKLALMIAAIDQLSGDEKMVLSLYYEQELSLKEIGLIMELSESRICQIHKKAILNARASVLRGTND